MSAHDKDHARLSVSAVDAVTSGPRGDLVNPAHYTRSSIEPIVVIEAWGLGFHLGNAVKYIARAGFKAGAEPIDDLSKAIWYLERARENLQAARLSPIEAALTELANAPAVDMRGTVEIDFSQLRDSDLDDDGWER